MISSNETINWLHPLRIPPPIAVSCAKWWLLGGLAGYVWAQRVTNVLDSRTDVTAKPSEPL